MNIEFDKYYTENGALFGNSYFTGTNFIMADGGKIKHKVNINPETVKRLEGLYTIDFYDERMESVSPENAIELHIGFDRGKTDADAKYIGKTIKATKKEMTLDYVLNKINADSAYRNFSEYFNKLISKYGMGAYPTTYGIGVFVAVGFRKSIEEAKSQIENILNDLGIEYTTEYSDAGWVFRYKISKSTENINRIKSILDEEKKATGGQINDINMEEINKKIDALRENAKTAFEKVFEKNISPLILQKARQIAIKHPKLTKINVGMGSASATGKIRVYYDDENRYGWEEYDYHDEEVEELCGLLSSLQSEELGYSFPDIDLNKLRKSK